ncbi:uridine diphosphate-N-acetylglucosamine-binding protein YvcK [Aliivibrio finisterrensis]|uniref:Putative gluconeogenesis factor n=1 Tax=Aliivibrio finisterrensis TaxID=511998 RepID=A0A6N6RY18_9GAMM|nr:uridine diphosphate-N-acetylglucosamine-binding protein YvcK [Aliivibrio finisterrensis]KAB2826515.1 uridine diphosphate-N-acetylglucosamine-binding protein YvcK [Aliivibrio finisterrensis]
MNEHQIVAIGGGHGLGRVLAALSDFGKNATGIVATTDNGGSTGRIRECQGGIAWGDTRNCINQLITDPSISSMMFEYRFKGQGELHGHNLGNLMLTALDNLSVRPLDAINLIRDMLKVETQIIPMSEHPSDLGALTTDLRKISGESNIDEMSQLPLRLFLDPEVPATFEAIEAVKKADLILLGPGSFLTSIMPPLLLTGLGKAIGENNTAKVVFIDNLSKEFGPAGKMDHKMMLEWCERACLGRKVDVILTDKKLVELQQEYDCKTTDLASLNHDWRHDRDKLKQAVINLLD